ncbi:phosphoenolpyruvate--protein phosphotransferase [Vibrio sp.]|nr:phosphoenolpyruvate--protein phosphotransferase [Vibrio sp.]
MLAQLRDIIEQISKVQNVHDALRLLVQEVCLAMEAECCSVYLSDTQQSELELIATQGLKLTQHRVSISFKEGLVGRVSRLAEPLNLANAEQHPDFKLVDDLGEEVYHGFLGVPVIHRRRVLGVLVVQQSSPRSFDHNEESFLVTLAAQLSGILAHAQAQGISLLDSIQHNTIHGVAASSGIAIGTFWCDEKPPSFDDVYPASTINVNKELDWLSSSIQAALDDFKLAKKQLKQEINKEALAIFDLFSHLLNDPMLRNDLKAKILTGDRADWALKQVITSYEEQFSQMHDAYLKQRSYDIKELGQRLLYFLHNQENHFDRIKTPIILVTRELTASILTAIPRDKLLGVVALNGAYNSHAAILARALNVPCVMGISNHLSDFVDKEGVLDGHKGCIVLSPSSMVLAHYQSQQQEDVKQTEKLLETAHLPAVTQDKSRINIFLNSGSAQESAYADQLTDGIGLYRTEVEFILNHSFPSEEEQYQHYRQVLTRFSHASVTMRTLDIGGDKPLPYLPINEDNPCLGWRGIRFTLDHPELFLLQIRAMLRASEGVDNLKILIPMVSNIKEIDDTLSLISQAYNELISEDIQLVMPKVGVMLEVPSLLYQLSLIAQRVDFVSVGTNDLTQYLLAVDRNNPQVAEAYDSYHPSILLALKHIRDECERLCLPVSVCGEMAGDPVGATLLVGMGYNNLSMNASSVAKVKYVLSHIDRLELQPVIEQALHSAFNVEVKQGIKHYFDSKQLSHFLYDGFLNGRY